MHQKSMLRNKVLERTAKACGVAVRTVYNVQREVKGSAGVLCTPYGRGTWIIRKFLAVVSMPYYSSIYMIMHIFCITKTLRRMCAG